MKVRALIAALIATERYDDEVYLCPNVQPVDAVESCPGDATWGLDPYVTLHSACRETA